MGNITKMFSRKTNGSAYLFVIGVISVLIIIVVFFFKSSSSRRFSTRMMSDEKKAEAVAESAVDLVMGFVKEKMNKPADLNFYPFFRYPCKLTQASLGTADGKNIPLEMANYDQPIEMLSNTPALSPIQYIVDELGGDDNVKVKVECRVSYAEAFAARKDGYQVVGVSKKSVPAVGVSAKFLDSTSALGGGSDDGSLSEYNSDWKVDFKLPNMTYTDTHKIFLEGVPSLVTVKKSEVRVTRLPPYDQELKVLGELWVTVKIPIIGTKVIIEPSMPNGSMTIDVMKYIRDFVAIDPVYPLLTMEALRDQAQEGDHNMPGLKWQAGNLINEINNEYGGLAPAIKSKIESDPYGSNPQVVEKTGVLQIKALVEYYPNGPSGKLIEKTLVANRPFKVTDVQPPAPEYTFFVGNSNLLFEGGGDNPAGLSLGNAIDWSSDHSVASICIHNLPGGEYEKATGLSGSSGGAGAKCQVPGMVRINSRQEMFVNAYIGTTDEPDLTEFNALVNKKSMANYNVLPTFRWKDSPANKREHELEFPVIRDELYDDDSTPPGFKNLINVISLCTALEAPTQLFGKCFVEYPLGMRLEAPMKQRYANLVLSVKPIGRQDDPYDFSEIHLKYMNKEKKYGIDGMEGYTSISDWSPDRAECLPANVYSLLQYAKKATHFYRSEAEFWADSKRFVGGVYICDGVTYIMGGLTINSLFQVKGNGILVVKENITLGANIKRIDDAVFTLMARAGYIHFTGGCAEVEASCFSNCSPMIENTSKLEIKGNLVVNEFDRDDVDFLEVFFDSAACRVTPLSIMRDVGKFDPKRYIVSVADNWSSYKFEKKE